MPLKRMKVNAMRGKNKDLSNQAPLSEPLKSAEVLNVCAGKRYNLFIGDAVNDTVSDGAGDLHGFSRCLRFQPCVYTASCAGSPLLTVAAFAVIRRQQASA